MHAAWEGHLGIVHALLRAGAHKGAANHKVSHSTAWSFVCAYGMHQGHCQHAKACLMPIAQHHMSVCILATPGAEATT